MPSTRRRLAIIGLIVFLAVDVLLVGWAVMAHRTPSGEPAGMQSSATGSATLAPSKSPAPSQTPTPTSVPQPDAVPPARVLAALDGTFAWRSSVGSCPGAPVTPESSSDGGATWKPSNVAGPTNATAIIALHALTTERASLVALSGANCAPLFVQTYVGGDNWAAYPDQTGGAWFVNPANRAVVHSPQGDKTAPCPSVVDLAERDNTSAAVLCSNHTVFRTADAGASWGTATDVPGSVALASAGNGYAIAVTGLRTCPGVAIATLDAGTSPVATGGCASVPAPAAGAVALAGGGGTLWLWAGDALVRSDNAGVAWH
ncbi:MAG: hypothetical protein ABI255_09210 [Microbacteriaceae bacterium]